MFWLFNEYLTCNFHTTGTQTWNSRMTYPSALRSLSTVMFINIIKAHSMKYSLRTTYLFFHAFRVLFPTASLIFTAVKFVSSSDMRKKEASSSQYLSQSPHAFWSAPSFAFIMAVVLNRKCTSCKDLRNVYILWCLTWDKTKNANKLSRVRSTDWMSSLS